MTVIWVLEDAARSGGVESVVRTLDTELKAIGTRSTILSWLPESTIDSRRAPWSWIRGKVAEMRRRASLAKATANTLRHHLETQPDLVVILEPGSMQVARGLVGAPRWGVHIHRDPEVILRPERHLAGENVPKPWIIIAALRMRMVGRQNARVLTRAPFVITLTPSHTQAMRQLSASVREIPNPVNCAVVWRVPRAMGSDVVTLGYVGRLSHEKGPDLLLDAIATISDELGPARLLIAGDGPMAAEVRARLTSLDLATEYLGWVEDVQQVFERIDILVLPSRREAVPIVLAHALAAGCRVVAASAGSGVADLLGEGALGRLVDPLSPETLGRAIAESVEELRRGKPGPSSDLVTSLVSRHSLSVVTRAWQDLLTELT